MSSASRAEPATPVQLGRAVSAYLMDLPGDEGRAQAPALSHFRDWLGPERELSSISPAELERYQDQRNEIGAGAGLEAVRAFLVDARKRRWTDTNLAVHLRIRRKSGAARGGAVTPEVRVEMTEAGRDALQRELERLEQEVAPKLRQSMQSAAADKDFRENAPYHAAKEQLAEVQTRINTLRATITAAEIVQTHSSERAGLGARVVLRDLDEDEELTYTLVGPGEIDARRGRISIQSPVGRAVSDHGAGETVEVQTPAGTARYRIERVEAAD
jgi:transcription elongation factor GreA